MTRVSREQLEQVARAGGIDDAFALRSCRPVLVEVAADGDRHAIRPLAYPGRLDLMLEPDGRLRPRTMDEDGPR